MKKNLAIVLILAVVSLVYFSVTFPNSLLLHKTQPPKVPAATMETEAIDNWKIYKNDKLGFSIKYPSNWIIITDSDRSVGWSVLVADNKDLVMAAKSFQVNIEYSNIFEIPQSGGKKVTITKNNLGYYAYAGNTPATGVFQSRPAIQSLDLSPLYGAHTSLRILDGKRLVEIKVDTNSDKDIALHNQILSTFKFLDSK